MKYIQFRDAGFVMFEDTMKHVDMANNFKSDKIISAGFVRTSIDISKIYCNGESNSLKESANISDAESLHRILNDPK